MQIQISPKIEFLSIALVFFLFAGAIFFVKKPTLTDNILFKPEEASPTKVTTRQIPEHVKGIYVTAYTTTLPEKMNSLINLVTSTELNAMVIDVKDYTGKVLYDSDVEMVNQYGLENPIISDVPALVKRLHEHGIYVIARQTIFQDPILAEKVPTLALKNTNGSLWRDYKGLAWVNPANIDVWKYNMDIAKEVESFGFDEINVDYVRFPSDGNLQTIVFTHLPKEKHDVMRDFYAFVRETFPVGGVQISADLFGFVMERHDGINIGQRLEDAVPSFDVISPMMYPSHYPSGHLGLANPAAFPGTVIDHGMKQGAPYFASSTARVRPWIQAFNIGAVYGEKNIRAQIDAVEAYPNAGWLLWNASNRYSSAGLTLAPTTSPK